jgi:glycosyltransferase involved in cell wall biosynthesis
MSRGLGVTPAPPGDGQALASPEVSVIVPTFNVGPYVAETLESILVQAGPVSFEVLVVDDRSTDDTWDAVNRIAARDARVRLMRNTGPQGAAAARNTGLQAARGEWVAFLDGDDLWMSDNLRLKLEAAAQCPGVAMVSSDFFNENRANRSVPRAEWNQLRQSLLPAWQQQLSTASTAAAGAVLVLDNLVQRFLSTEVLGNTGTIMVRRAEVEAVGGFDVTLEVGEDVLLWLLLASRLQRMAFVTQPLMYYRYRPGSLTNQGIPAHAFAAERFHRYLNSRPDFGAYARLIQRRLQLALHDQIFFWRRQRQFSAARKACWRLLAVNPLDASAWRATAAVLLRR